MARYPCISSLIDHNPRPNTDVLRAADRLGTMPTSTSLQPQREFDPPPDTVPGLTTQNDDGVVCPQFMLFGDSITQFSTLTLHSYLQTQYIRRLDVINRGFSGFTAPMGFWALQKLLPSSTDATTWPTIKLVTVFFGANDACVPEQPQHVELQSYVNTLKTIAQYPVFQQGGSRRTKIIIIAPPPVNEHQFEQAPHGPFRRRAGITSQYSRAAVLAGQAYGLHVLDFWSIIMHKVGWTASMGRDCCCKHLNFHLDSTSPPLSQDVQHIMGCSSIPESSPNADHKLSDFLVDGLHLTKLGYDVLFWELMKLIRRELPECAPENLPFVLPEWRNAIAVMEGRP